MRLPYPVLRWLIAAWDFCFYAAGDQRQRRWGVLRRIAAKRGWHILLFLVAAPCASVLLFILALRESSLSAYAFDCLILCAFGLATAPMFWIGWHVPGIRRTRNIKFAGPENCWFCGYNLTGNVSGRCPECGSRVVRTRNQIRNKS